MLPSRQQPISLAQHIISSADAALLQLELPCTHTLPLPALVPHPGSARTFEFLPAACGIRRQASVLHPCKGITPGVFSVPLWNKLNEWS